jgi:hypothetical protein
VSVCLTSVKVPLGHALIPMRYCMVLGQAVEKARGQSCPCDEICDGNDTQVRDRVAIVKNGHAKCLK